MSTGLYNHILKSYIIPQSKSTVFLKLLRSVYTNHDAVSALCLRRRLIHCVLFYGSLLYMIFCRWCISSDYMRTFVSLSSEELFLVYVIPSLVCTIDDSYRICVNDEHHHPFPSLNFTALTVRASDVHSFSFSKKKKTSCDAKSCQDNPAKVCESYSRQGCHSVT